MTTHGIRISVEPFFLNKQKSDITLYVWAYRVVIENTTDKTITIRSRYWHVVDIYGDIRDVKGDGIIGELPDIHPGKSYEYMSGVPLMNPAGIMMGQYLVSTESGNEFTVNIPPFPLESPFHIKILN